MTKAGRNDPCPCGSGKKYKKCCEVPRQRKVMTASVISSGGSTGKFSSLFQNSVQSSSKEGMSIAGKVSSGLVAKR